MDETETRSLRRAWREVLQGLWDARSETDRLPPEQVRIVSILEEHPEYHRFWEDPAALADDAGDSGINPFLHVQIHAMVESQIDKAHPRDVAVTLARLESAGLSRHEAVHRIGEALVREMGPAASGHEAFDVERYVQRLKGLKPDPD